MIIDEIRIYAEVLEQGLDFKSYITASGYKGKVSNIYSKKARGEFSSEDSLVDRIRKVKDVDVLISAISERSEYPLLMVEYSTAVPTDDHKMQRSDVYYWSSVFQVPMMKISPSEKGMSQDFGGGSRITDDQEKRLSFDKGALLYHIKWDSLEGVDVLPTKDAALSCIPYSEEIQETINTIISSFRSNNSFGAFYQYLKSCYEDRYRSSLRSTTMSNVKASIVNSSRFHWFGNKLSVKINRFGHAMDPDRGVLYYANMLVGAENTITEIQVNRPANPAARGGYNALFDALARKKELLEYVTKIIKTARNVFTDENAIHVFTSGLNIDGAIEFEKTGTHSYVIKDNVLKRFLLTHNSIVAKTIFFLSTELRLTDVNRDVICTIKWSKQPILEYLENINTNNRRPLRIKPLAFDDAKEDIITFASVELYKKLNYDLLAVSYPGAQGDRCILTGSGRNVLRTYIDIIAYKTTGNGFRVFLEECKDNFSKSKDDVDKLNNILSGAEERKGLKTLFRKTVTQDLISDVKISVAAKKTGYLPRFAVDYIFMFDITSNDKHTYIDYAVAIVDTTLMHDFHPLENNGRLTGRMIFDTIYTIDQ